MCILGTIITKYYTWGVSRYLLGTFSFWMCISTLENCQYYRHFSYFNLLPPWCLMRRRILYSSFLQNQSSIQALWSIFISAGLLSAVHPYSKRLFYFFYLDSYYPWCTLGHISHWTSSIASSYSLINLF